MKIKKVTKVFRKCLKLRYCGAVIVAAGSASRMEGIDKIMTPIADVPVILRTVKTFQNCDTIREIVIVTRKDLIEPIKDLCRDMDKVIAVVEGGSSRSQSVQRGICALSRKAKLVAVHDGARPFASPELIDRVVRTANAFGASVPGIPVKDTVKVVGGGMVKSTPDRNTLRAVQTPQVFDRDLLMGALTQAEKTGAKITDDCSAVELLGMNVRIVDGEERNIKITTPMDLQLAKLLAEEWI